MSKPPSSYLIRILTALGGLYLRAKDVGKPAEFRPPCKGDPVFWVSKKLVVVPGEFFLGGGSGLPCESHFESGTGFQSAPLGNCRPPCLVAYIPEFSKRYVGSPTKEAGYVVTAYQWHCLK